MAVTVSNNFGNDWSEWACPVMFLLASAWSKNNPELTGYNDGFLESLVSPANMSAGPEKIEGGGGTQIRIGYRQRKNPDDVVETKMQPCATQTDKELFEDNFELDLFSTDGWKFTVPAYEKMCQEFKNAQASIEQIMREEQMGELTRGTGIFRIAESSRAFEALINMMPYSMMNVKTLIDTQNALRQNMNRQLVSALYASFVGSFAGPAASASPLSVNVITAANGALVYKGFQDILFEYKKAKQSGMAIAVGFNLLERALSSFTDYCCNTMGAGANVNSLDPMRKAGQFAMHYYADQNVNDLTYGASTTEDFIVYSPGSLKLFTKNEFEGVLARKNNNVYRGVIGDIRIPGLAWDYTIVEDGCADAYTFNLGLQYGLWGRLPATTYPVGDNLNGVNGVFHFTANAI